jgi:isocitrate dehydrogenase
MPTLESSLEKAKKAVEVAKENYEKAKPTEAQFKELGYGHMNERNIEHWVQSNRASKKHKEERAKPAIKALIELELAKAKLGRAEVLLHNKNLEKDKKVNKGGRTRRSKGGSKKTRRNRK